MTTATTATKQIYFHRDDGTPCYFGAYACHSYGCDEIVLIDVPADLPLHASAPADALAAALARPRR